MAWKFGEPADNHSCSRITKKLGKNGARADDVRYGWQLHLPETMFYLQRRALEGYECSFSTGGLGKYFR